MSILIRHLFGRGLLARPSLFEERLCGAAQFRDKMKPYWEYAPATIERKLVKQGKKFGMPD